MTDIASNPGRRRFLQGTAAAAGVAALTGFDALAARTAGADHTTGWPRRGTDYGPLHPAVDGATGETLISLPDGFRYVTFGRTGEVMDDGIPTPSLHDGMAAFGYGRYVRVVRNHEQSAGPAFATGMTYDAAAAGGTTTFVFDRHREELVSARASLAGTIRNCAGGPTPWGSWLSCEETTDVLGDLRHGYVFEVPVHGHSDGQPLKAMGRFSHEAVAVDPWTGIVYLTEDATPSGLYRFIPHRRGRLAAGGRLQMLTIGDAPYQTYLDPTGTDYGRIGWVDIDEPDPAPGDHHHVAQGIAKGGASISRGEGIWYGNGRVYVVSTNGGPVGQGQVFELDPRRGRFRVLFASPDAATLNAPDNITVSPRGGMVLCEDGSGTELLHGLSTRGEIFPFAENLYNSSEWAGATFAPGRGDWLFANLQTPGITFAITGPWHRGGL